MQGFSFLFDFLQKKIIGRNILPKNDMEKYSPEILSPIICYNFRKISITEAKKARKSKYLCIIFLIIQSFL